MPENSSEEKVYSPDLKTISFEGLTGVFNIIGSVVTAPVRLLLRVVHNIVILPADLMLSYAESLFLVGVVLEIIGIFDFFILHKWVLLVSQVPVIILAVKLKSSASRSVTIARQKTEVEIDTEKIEELCNEISTELDAIVKEDQ